MDTPALNIENWRGLSFALGDGVSLRRFRKSDADALFGLVKKNEKHLHFMHWITPDYSLEMAHEFIDRTDEAEAKGESLGFGIFRGDRLIGVIGFVYFDRTAHKTEIGYWIDAGEEGKGIISMAARELINWAFDAEKMNRVEIRCSTENIRSAAVPKRLGFSLEAHLRQSEYRHGRLVDFYVFGLLKDEWKG
jgi:ribosomal-protein-serine acetyltransferase